MRLEIHLGTFKPHHFNLNKQVLQNTELVMVVKDFPPPRVDEIIYGRSKESGAQFVAKVAWVTHHYEEGVIRVYAGNT